MDNVLSKHSFLHSHGSGKQFGMSVTGSSSPICFKFSDSQGLKK